MSVGDMYKYLNQAIFEKTMLTRKPTEFEINIFSYHYLCFKLETQIL